MLFLAEDEIVSEYSCEKMKSEGKHKTVVKTCSFQQLTIAI